MRIIMKNVKILFLLMLSMLPLDYARATEKVLLEEKYVPGETLVYKQVISSVDETVGLLKAENVVTRKVLGKNESGKIKFETNSGEWKITECTYKIKPTGYTPPFSQPSVELENFLPQGLVKVGDSWVQRIKIYLKPNQETILEIKHVLAGFSEVKGFNCAVIESVPYVIPKGENFVSDEKTGEIITYSGTLTLEGISYFAINEGKLIKIVTKGLGVTAVTSGKESFIKEHKFEIVMEL